MESPQEVMVCGSAWRVIDLYIYKLNLDSYITSLCKKAGQKLSAVARINNYITLDQKLLLLQLNLVVIIHWSGCLLLNIYTMH